MNLCNFAENKLIDAMFRGQSITFPTTWYFALIIATLGYSSAVRSTAVTSGATVIPTTPNGRIYRCSTSGTTGASEPTWPTTSGGTVTDGTAVWTEMTPDLEAGTNLTVPGGGAYGRASLAASLANFSGTQSEGSTSASSGTDGGTSNNAAITYAAPSGANWGLAWGYVGYDASTSGNPWIYDALTTPRQINDGDAAPSFAIGALDFQIDN